MDKQGRQNIRLIGNCVRRGRGAWVELEGTFWNKGTTSSLLHLDVVVKK